MYNKEIVWELVNLYRYYLSTLNFANIRAVEDWKTKTKEIESRIEDGTYSREEILSGTEDYSPVAPAKKRPTFEGFMDYLENKATYE